MKILYVVGHFIPHIGGVEILFNQYAKGMLEAGHEVRVVTSSSGGIVGHETVDGVEVWGYDWKMLFGHPLARTKDIEEHVKWADLVHTTTFTVANPTRKACKKYNKPSLITIHEVLGDKWYWIESNKPKALGYKMFEKYVCCKPYDYIHVISEATEGDYIKFYGKRDNMRMIYNSLDSTIPEIAASSKVTFEDIFDVPKECRRFLYFGRPGQSKGIFVLLSAIEKLNREHSDKLKNIRFCFLISNDPAKQRSIFEKRIAENGLSDLVMIHDPVKRNDLFKVISETDYVIVPSITEGFGFSAGEACMLHKSIIYSDGGSLPEVVFGNTLAFKNRDSDDLAEKIRSVIDKGEEAFDYIPDKDFSTEKMINTFLDYYDQIAKERGINDNS